MCLLNLRAFWTKAYVCGLCLPVATCPGSLTSRSFLDLGLFSVAVSSLYVKPGRLYLPSPAYKVPDSPYRSAQKEFG